MAETSRLLFTTDRGANQSALATAAPCQALDVGNKKMTEEKRPPIPAEIERKVLVEAGHRCAIPTCRHIHVEIHHIIPWATCQKHDYDNLIALCPNCHTRAHNGEIDKKSLRIYKANLRFAHDKFSQLEIDTLFDLYSLPKGKGRPWPQYLNLMLKRLFDSKYVDVSEMMAGMIISGVKSTPDILYITDEGRAFIDSLGIEHK